MKHVILSLIILGVCVCAFDLHVLLAAQSIFYRHPTSIGSMMAWGGSVHDVFLASIDLGHRRSHDSVTSRTPNQEVRA